MGSPAARHALSASTVGTHTDTLTSPYEAVWRSLLASLAHIRATFPTEPAAVRRRRAGAFAAQAVSLIDQLDARADPLVADAVRGVVKAAARDLIVELGRTLEVRKGVTDAAVAELLADLRAASAYTLTTARVVARAVARVADVDGDPRVVAAALEGELRDRGLAAVVYRDGSRHGLAEYARMAARTKLAETWQRASFDLFAQVGVTFVEVTDGAGCGWTSHDDPDKANGTIRSLEEAGAYPLAHPNCGRTTYPRLDVRTEADAASARPLSRAVVPDEVSAGDRAPAIRTSRGTLDTRALAVLAPAAMRQAQMLARVQTRDAGTVGASVRRATRATPRTQRAPRRGGTG